MQYLYRAQWSPYIVGIGIGILSWISFLVSKKALGTSTTYARTAGMLEKLFNETGVSNNQYYQKITAEINWQWMLVLGIVLGSLFSSLISGEFGFRFIPETDFPSFVNYTVWGRFLSALFGGLLLGFGSRLASGCTSGHGISGTMQLSIASWLAAISFFVGGIITAFIIF